MKTAGTQLRTSAAHPPFKTKNPAHEPDRIIMPLSDAQEPPIHRYMTPVEATEYTAFEEVTSSDAYDELAFQDYADDDPTLLKVGGGRSRA